MKKHILSVILLSLMALNFAMGQDSAKTTAADIIPENDSVQAAAFSLRTFAKLQNLWEQAAYYSSDTMMMRSGEKARVLRSELLFSPPNLKHFYSDSITVEDDLTRGAFRYLKLHTYLVNYRIFLDEPNNPKISISSPQFMGLFKKGRFFIGVVGFLSIKEQNGAQIDTIQRVMYVVSDKVNEPERYKIFKIVNSYKPWEPPKVFRRVQAKPLEPQLSFAGLSDGYIFNPHVPHKVSWDYNIDEPVKLVLRTLNKSPKAKSDILYQRIIPAGQDTFIWLPAFSHDSIKMFNTHPLTFSVESTEREAVATLGNCRLSPPLIITKAGHHSRNGGTFVTSSVEIKWEIAKAFKEVLDHNTLITIDLFKDGSYYKNIDIDVPAFAQGQFVNSYRWIETQDCIGTNYQIRISVQSDPENLITFSEYFSIQKINSRPQEPALAETKPSIPPKAKWYKTFFSFEWVKDLPQLLKSNKTENIKQSSTQDISDAL